MDPLIVKLEKVLKLTKIINAAAKSNDLLIIENLLEEREVLIENLHHKEDKLSKEEQSVFDEIINQDQMNQKEMKVMIQNLGNEFKDFKFNKSKIEKKNDATRQYINPYTNLHNGKFDNKV